MNPDPARDAKNGSDTHAAIAEARQASTALPPFLATAAAASAPNWFPAAMPNLFVSVMAGRVLAPTLGLMTDRHFEIEDSRHAACPPGRVLARILSPSTWPEWQSEILAVEGPERLQTGDVVHGDAKLLGFEVEGHSSSLEVTPDSFLEDVIVGVRMRVRYSVEADGDGTRVTHRLESRLPTGIAGRVLSLLLRWRLRKMQARLLEDLVAQCGAGSSASAG